MFKIDLMRLGKGINPLSLSFMGDIPLFSGLGVKTIGNGTIEGSVNKRDDNFFIFSFTLNVPSLWECSRCLEEFDKDVSADVSFIALRKGTRGGEDYGRDPGEDLILLGSGQQELDMGDLVREYFILNIPVYPLCREDCRGLCAGCGVNLNKENCTCSN
jgi:uncharacterized metal-binding protein YceD (DUF177 family)